MIQILLVDDLLELQHLEQEVLDEAGYYVVTTSTADDALSTLRTSPDPMIVLFCTRVGSSLLQAAVDEPSLRRHAYVLLTATPEFLTPLWRVLLSALDVPVVAKPFTLGTLLATVADAATRLGDHNGGHNGEHNGKLIPA